ncbi:uncharacterized protein LOC108907751 [Anoplophora glabripennis]|uniref:uncharacterized protein LOC108907751 n=1 Tax=Anoplophora glabripennis TaxID=217634 RepID=UPI00087391DF|nr:uncharacterized protein LOC108907751 [Anoplophora glabripennis]
MKHSTTFKEMLPWQAWAIISLSWGVCAELSDHCRRPKITSSESRSPFLVYQQTATVNVTVYHCQYLEENVCDSDICSNCLTGIPEFTVIGSSTYRYSDITQNCLECFSNKTAKFKDKFSFPHSNNTRLPYTYSCHNNTKLLKAISAVLTKYDAEAHIARDEIVLKSGTVCRYSSGFCHDEKEDIDVMWQVQSGFHCHHFKTINISDSYYFKLNQKRYAIIELYGNYSALELKSSQIKKCNLSTSDLWETQHQGLIVTKKPISNASNIPLQRRIIWDFPSKKNKTCSIF